MIIFCNRSIHLSNKPECQPKDLNWSISFIPVPFIWYQGPGDLLIRVLSWSLFSERGAGEISAGNTRICSRASKNNSKKGGRIQGGVEAKANLEGPLYPEWPCMSGFFLMTSSWVGSLTKTPGMYTLFFFFLVKRPFRWHIACVCVCVEYYIGHSSTLSLFQAQDVRKQA